MFFKKNNKPKIEEVLISFFNNNKKEIENILLDSIKEFKNIENFKVEEPETLINKEEVAKHYFPNIDFKNSISENYNLGVKNGFGGISETLFVLKSINYSTCNSYSQEPLINKIINKYINSIFDKGGKLIGISKEEVLKVNKKAQELDIIEKYKEAIRIRTIHGGCLLYLDFDNTLPSFLKEKININSKDFDISKFKGIKPIEPILTSPFCINNSFPTQENYNKPEYYFILGLGMVHKSHFIKLDGIYVPPFLKANYLYFGNSYVNIIKEICINFNILLSNLIELTSKMRTTFIQKDFKTLGGQNLFQNLASRLKLMQKQQNNSSLMLIDKDEELKQFVSNLNGLPQSIDIIIKCVSIITDLPASMLNNTNNTKIVNSQNEDPVAMSFIKSKQDAEINNLELLYKICYCLSMNKKSLAELDYNFELNYKFNDIENLDKLKKTIIISKNLENINNFVKLGFTKESIEKTILDYEGMELLQFGDDFEYIREKIIESEFKVAKQDTSSTTAGTSAVKQSYSAEDNREDDEVNETENGRG